MARRKQTIGEKIDSKKRRRRGESNTQHERMKMTHEIMLKCALPATPNLSLSHVHHCDFNEKM